MENPNAGSRVATAGEALIDLISHADGRYEACPGGAVFNLTRAIARQGIGVAYLNPLSSDRFGRQLAALLQADGVLLAEPLPVRHATALAVVGVNEAGQPDYAFYREGVADRATTAEQLGRLCARQQPMELVCTGCLALAPEDSGIYLPWMRAQRAQGRMLVVDVNLRPSVVSDRAAYRRNVFEALQLAHIIKASDEDLESLGVRGPTALERAQRLLASTSAGMLALTLGASGACLLARDGTVWRAREAAPVALVDSVGAGDCFLAGLLVALLQAQADPMARLAGLDDALAYRLLARAVASASLCVMRRGAMPPTGGEVDARLAAASCIYG